MKIITTANAADYYRWFAEAMVDDGVWPYLSMEPRYSPSKVEDDDWERRIVMDDSGRGVCILRISRVGDRSLTLALWVLSGPTRCATAAALLRDAIALGSRYDCAFIDTTCHASNEASRRVNTKFFGEPWGVEPHGAWNGKLRAFEPRLCFRIAAAEAERRIG